MEQASTVVRVTDLLRRRAEAFPDRTALNIDGTDALDYGDWQRRVDRTAHGLLGIGVTKGSRIGLLYGGMDWTDYAVAYLAVLSAGATALHLSDRLGEPEIERRLSECQATGVIHSSTLRPPASFTGWTAEVAGLDSGDETPVDVPLAPEDIADVLYTSGTTGPAKAFTNPHGNLTFGRGPEGLLQFENPTPLLAPMPLGTTSSATTIAIIAVTSPSALVLAAVDDVERMAELISRHRIGFVMITPWIAMRMLATRIGERYDLSCVERVAIASAPLAPALSRGLLKTFPAAELNTAYSQSEAVPAVVTNTFDPARPAPLAGRPGAVRCGSPTRRAPNCRSARWARSSCAPPRPAAATSTPGATPRCGSTAGSVPATSATWTRGLAPPVRPRQRRDRRRRRGAGLLGGRRGGPVRAPGGPRGRGGRRGFGPGRGGGAGGPGGRRRAARLPGRPARTAPADRPGRAPRVAAAGDHRQGAQADPAPGAGRPVAPAARHGPRQDRQQRGPAVPAAGADRLRQAVPHLPARGLGEERRAPPVPARQPSARGRGPPGAGFGTGSARSAGRPRRSRRARRKTWRRSNPRQAAPRWTHQAPPSAVRRRSRREPRRCGASPRCRGRRGARVQLGHRYPRSSIRHLGVPYARTLPRNKLGTQLFTVSSLGWGIHDR